MNEKSTGRWPLKDALTDISIIFRPVNELGLENSSLGHPKVSNFYKRIVGPNQEKFLKKYGVPPERYLDQFVKSCLGSKIKTDEFYTVPTSCDCGNVLTNGVGVNILRKGFGPSPNLSPYLYIWAGSSDNEILSLGFDYGDGIKNGNPSVNIVKKDKQLRSLVYDLPRKNKHILVGDNKGKDVFFKYVDVEEIGDFVDSWNSNYSLTGDFNLDEVTDNIEMIITAIFDGLWPLFEKTSKVCPKPN